MCYARVYIWRMKGKEKLCIVGIQVVAVINFGAILRPFGGARGPKVCRGVCHVTLRLLGKFRPNRFRFAGVIPEKVISYDHSTPSA